MRWLLLLLLLPISAPSLQAQADLHLSAVSTSPVYEGRPVTTRISLRNDGPAPATDVKLQIQGSGRIISFETAGGICTAFGRTLFCTAATLAPGETLTVTDVRTAPRNEMLLTAAASSSVSDPDAADNALELRTAVLPTADIVASFQYFSYPRMTLNEPFRATLYLTNNGPSAFPGGTLRVKSNDVLRLLSYEGEMWRCSRISDSELECVANADPPGLPSTALTLELLPITPGEAYIEATFQSSGVADPVMENNTTVLSQVVGVYEAGAYERVLVPLPSGGIPGGEGAYWRSSLSMYSNLDRRLDVSGPIGVADVLPFYDGGPIPPKSVVHFSRPQSAGGFVFYVKRAIADRLSFSLVAKNGWREEDEAEQIPVVRERNLRREVTTLLDVVASPDTTGLLRIYDVSENVNPSVRVTLTPIEYYCGTGCGHGGGKRIAAEEPWPPQCISTFDLQLTTPQRQGVRVIEPSYATLPVPVCLPFGSYSATIEPLTPGMEFWPYATSTNRLHHTIRISTPQ